MFKELEPWVIKQLLGHIELSGNKLQSNISLINLCNTAEQILGFWQANADVSFKSSLTT
jgi:hypothetical protein